MKEMVNLCREKPGKNNTEQECIPVGCVPAVRRPYAGVCFPGGCLVQGGSAPRGVPGLEGYARGGMLPGGCMVWGCMVWGVYGPGGLVSQQALRQNPPPPVNRMTNRCKNITLATTSLRPVKIKQGQKMLDFGASKPGVRERATNPPLPRPPPPRCASGLCRSDVMCDVMCKNSTFLSAHNRDSTIQPSETFCHRIKKTFGM